MALPKIEPLSSEFEVSKNDSNAVKVEIEKLGKVIFEKTNTSLKSATQAVVSNVPDMIKTLTTEIESGPIDSFGNAINKLVKFHKYQLSTYIENEDYQMFEIALYGLYFCDLIFPPKVILILHDY